MAEKAKRVPLKKYDQTKEIKTYNVGNAIAEIIQKEKVIPASVDFDIKQIATFIKEPGQDEFNSLNENHLQNLKKESYLLNDTLKITQKYVIELKPAVPDANFRPVIAISTDPMKCIARATVKRNSIITNIPNLRNKLIEYFNKVKLRHHMLINVNDAAMLKSIDALAKQVESGGFKSDMAVWLAKWPKASLSKDDAIEYLYKTKTKKDLKETDKVDHADRGFIIGVEKDEDLVVYRKAKHGKPGRNFSGIYIPIEEPNSNNIPSFEPDKESILIEEDEEKKIYRSLSDGFVTVDRGLLTVSQEMRLKNVTLKDTGHVKPGLNSKVKINVASGDAAEDAVGPDMIIEATEITVVGSIGAGAVLIAKKINVNGQTHNTTKLYANDLEVGVLKGYAEANKATIKSIEQGTVYADHVSIETAVGGDINGRRVEIKDIRSPSKIRAAQAVLFEKVGCGENKIYLDQRAVIPAREAIDAAKQTIKDANKVLKEQTDEMVKTSKYIRDNKKNFNGIKERIMESKKRGEAPSSALVKIFKEYLGKMKRLDEIHSLLEKAEKDMEESKVLLEELDNEMMSTFVFNEGLKWHGASKVHFVFYGKAFDASKLIDNYPAAEVIGVKKKEKEGLVAVVGVRDDFPKLEIYEEHPFRFTTDPFASVTTNEEDDEEDEDNEKQKEEKKPETKPESEKKTEES